jgi:hypothetical protein
MTIQPLKGLSLANSFAGIKLNLHIILDAIDGGLMTRIVRVFKNAVSSPKIRPFFALAGLQKHQQHDAEKNQNGCEHTCLACPACPCKS